MMKTLALMVLATLLAIAATEPPVAGRPEVNATWLDQTGSAN